MMPTGGFANVGSQSYSYCGNFAPPRAPALQELQMPKLLALPTMPEHRPPMLASSLSLRVDAVKGASVVA
jgi:hypothetical protein